MFSVIIVREIYLLFSNWLQILCWCLNTEMFKLERTLGGL